MDFIIIYSPSCIAHSMLKDLSSKDQAAKIKMEYRRLYRHLVKAGHIARDSSRIERGNLDYR